MVSTSILVENCPFVSIENCTVRGQRVRETWCRNRKFHRSRHAWSRFLPAQGEVQHGPVLGRTAVALKAFPFQAEREFEVFAAHGPQPPAEIEIASALPQPETEIRRSGVTPDERRKAPGHLRAEFLGMVMLPGTDDYIVKPFSPTELTARIGAALRRRAEPVPFVLGDLAIDYDRRRVSVAGRTGSMPTRWFRTASSGTAAAPGAPTLPGATMRSRNRGANGDGRSCACAPRLRSR